MSLPSGYKRLEYIKSTGAQHLDTLFKPNNHTRVVIDFRSTFSTANSPKGLLGSRNSSDVGMFAFLYSNRIDPTYNGVGKSVTVDSLQRHVYDFNQNSFSVDGAAVSFDAGVFSSGYNLLLLSVQNYGTIDNRKAEGYLYSCQIYDNGTLIRDYIPCQTTAGEIGLWDDVNSVFYGNAGTGTFTAGPEVPKAPSAPSGFTALRLTDTAVQLNWTASDGATGYNLYRDGILIATLSDTSYTDVIQPFTPYVYTLTAYNENGEGYAAELVVFLSPDNPILWLVTDRTQEDVTARNSKGVYQAVDLNRVGAAVEYLQKRLFAAGVLADVSPRTDWTDSMWMSAGEAKVYLDNVKTMRAALAMPKGTPTAPDDMEKLTYVEADHIEMFLVILDALLTDMVFAYRHCGVTTCGMGGLIL